MKRCFVCAGYWLWIYCPVFALPALSQTLSKSDETMVLAQVELAGPVESFSLPVHAILQDSAGKDYLLVIGTGTQLLQTDWPWRVLDQNAVADQFVIATEFRRGAREAAAARFTPLLDDGIRWVLRATPEAAGELAELGFELQRLTPEPMILSRSIRPAIRSQELLGQSSMPDPLVSAMVNRVVTTNLYWLVRRLTGEEPDVIGGEPRIITTRHTASGLPVHKALERVLERLSALGLNVQYTNWSASGYVNSNVVATLTGGALSNELVLVTAHLDDQPSGDRAPGADDNCSGSAAVLTAAGIFSQYRFDRSIRFVLFTGEEQGLLGSSQYAAAAKAAGDNIVAVLNLDMIAWNDPTTNIFQLHTRSSGTGYTNDLAIASVFTNAISAYGLTNQLAPVIKPDGITASDHYYFWYNGYAAILAIEDYGGDFNPYYHTTNDTLAHFNLPYFTASVQAAVATVAHLAGPVSRVPSADAIELASSDWIPGSGIGAGVLLARHLPGATETGSDPWDLVLTNAPANPDTNWLQLTTAPYGVALVTDSRPTNSETLFTANLTVVAPTGAVVSCSNRLRFDFMAPAALDRLYTARIQVNGQFTQPTNFLCVTNLLNVVTPGGYLDLPKLTNAAVGTVYGTCEIAGRLLDTNRASCHLRLLSIAGSTLELGTDAQISGRIIDEFEICTNLAGNRWVWMVSYTNDVLPDIASFDTGWKQLTRTVDVSSLPAASEHYFRFKRTWPAP
ncbi:MAG: M28 family metallopeptidase [Verrucomicrobiota bacterium]|jgi:hypothetical protein